MKRAEKYAMSAARIFTDLAQDKGYKAGEPATYFDTLVPYAQHFIDQGYRAIYIPRAAAAAYLAECLAALAPESNTEQAQQNAAELEQAEPRDLLAALSAAGCFDELGRLSCYKHEVRDLLTQANLLALVAAGLLRRTFGGPATYGAVEYYLTSQPSMFAATNADLPLFSGTAPRATVTPFVETEPQPTTPRLF